MPRGGHTLIYTFHRQKVGVLAITQEIFNSKVSFLVVTLKYSLLPKANIHITYNLINTMKRQIQYTPIASSFRVERTECPNSLLASAYLPVPFGFAAPVNVMLLDSGMIALFLPVISNTPAAQFR